MNDITIESWSHFTSISDHLDMGDISKISYAFRGHADANWKLVPTFLRCFKSSEIIEEIALKLEEKAINEFKSQAHLYLKPNEFSITKDTISWLTVMQHYGAPTRLLDWTKSIYTAAYFASSSHLDMDGAIWLVHAHALHLKMKDLYNDNTFPKTQNEIKSKYLLSGAPHELLFTERLSKSDRMITQQGFFSICRNILGDHGQILQEVFQHDSSKEIFRKLIIPSSQKRTFLKKLRSMNVTAISLFPGLDGLGKSISEFVHISNS